MLLHYNPPRTPYLRILYQDDDLLVLDKPSGLLSVPGKDPKHTDCLILCQTMLHDHFLHYHYNLIFMIVLCSCWFYLFVCMVAFED